MKRDKFVAGEFVWTGFDYLGEPTPYTGRGVKDAKSAQGQLLAVQKPLAAGCPHGPCRSALELEGARGQADPCIRIYQRR